MDKLQIILLEEGEFTDHNYDLIQSALKYGNTYLKDKNGELFLTVVSLITLNNIITNSNNLFLRDVNVKPAHGRTDCYEKCAATARSCCHSSILASVKIFK